MPTGGGNDGFGIGMVGPTIMAMGTEAQKKYYIPRILSGEDLWCQGYSEPDAGSDLANLGTRAVLDGDEWVINGQKIWTSNAQTANWIFVLCRTAPESPKHAGISFLLAPMNQPGIEIRPIINIAGRHEFNEVFFTDVRTAKDNVVGEVNNGWAVANTLLGFERGGRSTVLYLTYREELDRLLAFAGPTGATKDPLYRQDLARAHTKVEIMRWMGQRTLSQVLAGKRPGPESSLHEAAVVRVPQGDHRGCASTSSAPRRWPRSGRQAAVGYRRRRRRGAVLQPELGRRQPSGAVGHDLRRHQPGAAQHRGRAGARPAQGTTGRRRPVGQAP